MTESTLSKRIFLQLGKRKDIRLFRNNVGLAFMGQIVEENAARMVLKNARRVKFGLMKGSGDYIGFKKIKITPEMVGKTVAQFLSIEVKTESGKLKPEQESWFLFVNSSGGCAYVVRSEEEASKIPVNP